MDNKIITGLLALMSLIVGNYSASLLPLGGAIENIELTERQVYILTEVLRGQDPSFDLNKDTGQDILDDYAKVTTLVGNKISDVIKRCSVSEKDCSLYDAINTKVAEVKLSVESAEAAQMAE